MKNRLVRRINERKASIAVIGLGHVGLTTAAIFANVGFSVIGVDIRKEVLQNISSGRSCTGEPALDELVQKVVENGKLQATADASQASQQADVEIICVQTPVTHKNKPYLTYLEKACKSIVQGPLKGKLVVVESTLPPGTTKNKVVRILEEGSKLKCGRDFWLAHCPERMAIGRAAQDFEENARIIGGYNPESTEIAAALFKTVSKGELLLTDCTTAEVAKLAENTYRYVNIAFANELALICEKICVDVVDVIKLANTHPRVNIHSPGCGVGGPCLPKDTYLLLDAARGKEFKPRIIESSRRVNEYMPRHTIELLAAVQEKFGRRLRGKKIVVLGSAYRGEVDDARNSPSERIVQRLISQGAEVAVYDPYCEESFGAKKAENLFEAVKGANCLMIVTDHKIFSELDLKSIKSLMTESPVIIDGRRVLDPAKATKQGFKYVGIGRCA